MDIKSVGLITNPSFQHRNFYDFNYRQKTESILNAFAEEFKIQPLTLEWSNIGNAQEDDIHSIGVALRINKHYAITYTLVAEDFELLYYDPISPKEISTLEESDCLEDMMSALFKEILTDWAKAKADQYFDVVDERGDFPQYADEPKRNKQKPKFKVDIANIKAFG